MNEADDAVERIEAQLMVLARATEAIYRKRGYPLERAHYLMLRRLGEQPMSIGELAQELALEHSTVTRQIETMRRNGLVRRQSNPADKRSVLIQATEAGLELCESTRRIRRERVGLLLAGWSDGDRQTFAELLTRLNGALAASLAATLDLGES
jgi:DNA-binding MarR family transcriptional regulator